MEALTGLVGGQIDERYLIRTAEGNHSKPAHSIAVSHALDRDFIVTGSVDRKVRFLDGNNGEEVAVCLGHKRSVMAVAISSMGPNGEDPLICSGGRDGSIIVWDPDDEFSGRMVRIPLEEIRCIAVYQGSETFILVGNKEGKLVLWDLTNDVAVVTFEGSKGCIHCCAITSLVTDPETQNDLEHLCIASGGADRCVRLWNLFNPTDKKRKLRHSRSVGCIAIAGKGFRPVLASGASDNNITIWDITSGLQLQVLEGHKGPVNQLTVWEGYEILIISASADRTVRVFDALTGECVCTLVGHTDDVLDLAVTGEQTSPAVASCSLDNTIKFWDLDAIIKDFFKSSGEDMGARNTRPAWNPHVEYTAPKSRAEMVAAQEERAKLFKEQKAKRKEARRKKRAEREANGSQGGADDDDDEEDDFFQNGSSNKKSKGKKRQDDDDDDDDDDEEQFFNAKVKKPTKPSKSSNSANNRKEDEEDTGRPDVDHLFDNDEEDANALSSIPTTPAPGIGGAGRSPSKTIVGKLVDDDEDQVVEISSAEPTCSSAGIAEGLPNGAIGIPGPGGKVLPEGAKHVGLSINMTAMVVSAVRRMSTRITFAKKFHSNSVHPELEAAGILDSSMIPGDGSEGGAASSAGAAGAAGPGGEHLHKLPSARGSLTRKSVSFMHRKADELQQQFAQAEKSKLQEVDKAKSLAQQKLTERLNKRKGITNSTEPSSTATIAEMEETEEDKLHQLKQEKLLQHKLQESRMRKAMQEAQSRSAQMLQKRLDEIAAKRALNQVISDDEDSDSETKPKTPLAAPVPAPVPAPALTPAVVPAPAPARDIFYLSDDED